MRPYYADRSVTVHHGDCLDVLRTLPDASVDSVVTDPPYGLGFMGKEWDDLPPGLDFAVECLRVLKPGGHLLAFGGTRTWHRLACAVEDAGFEVRDSIAWLYGSGFPKSLDVSKAIDKAAGAEREVVGVNPRAAQQTAKLDATSYGAFAGTSSDLTAPATPDAERWQGWGTALKPAFEPIVVARKPLVGTVSQNVLTHGTGALNIDATRIGETVETWPKSRARPLNSRDMHHNYMDGGSETVATGAVPAGRWPANVVLDESQADALDEQSGPSQSPSKPVKQGGRKINGGRYNDSASGEVREGEGVGYGDLGGASRFFYIARKDNEPCPTQSHVSTAAETSSPPSEHDDSAPSGAATSAHLDTAKLTDSPSTSETPIASRPSAANATPLTRSTGAASGPGSQPGRHTPSPSPASGAATVPPTDTTTTTTSPPRSAGSAASATSRTTPNSVPGVPLDGLGSRFTYVAKADASERPRVNGTAHPTVKPLALMRWLVRLVTPPGGTVLEPFAGSGTTVEACIVEHFHCIAIEKGAEYLPLIEARIARRRDPVRAIELGGEDMGLFGIEEVS